MTSLDNRPNIEQTPQVPADASELLLPAHTESNPAEVATTDSTETESFLHKHWKKLVAGLAGVALLAGAGAVAENLANKAPTPQTTSSAEANPSSTPAASSTPEASATPTASASEMTQAQIDAYEKKIANGEFFSLPKQEQLTYWTQLASGKGNNMSIIDFASDYALTSNNPAEKFTTPSLANTPSQVENIATNAIRFALSLDIKSPDAKAAMYAVFNDNSATSTGHYAGFNSYLENFPGTMSGRVQGSKNVIVEAPIVDEENTKVQHDSNGQPYMDIKTSDPDGSIKTTRYVYIELPGSQIDGVDAMWIQE
jgi:TolA-binding protein